MKTHARYAFAMGFALVAGCRADGAKDSVDAATPGSSAVTDAILPRATRTMQALRGAFVVVDEEGNRYAAVPRGEANGFHLDGASLVPTFGGKIDPSFVAPTVTLPAHADGAFRLVLGEMSIDVRIAGARPAAAETTSDAVLYRDAVAGATLVHVPRRVGTEEFFVLPEKQGDSAIRYDVAMHGVAGLRSTEGVLELLDATGNPVLRTQAPTIFDASGAMRRGTIDVEGCAVDRSPLLPWGRPTTPVGADHCTVVTRWSDEGLTYPLLVDPAWTTTNVLAQHRAKHRSASITGTSGVAACSSGCVLVTGGVDVTTALSSCELYNAATGTFASAAALPSQSYGAASAAERAEHVAIDTGEGRVVVAGGHYLSSPSTVTYATAIYSPATNAWTALGNLGTARARLAGAMTSNGSTREIVVSGGNVNPATAASNAVDRLDFPALTWETGLKPPATARYAHAMAGYVYSSVTWYVVAGGLPGPTATVEITDSGTLTSAGTWTAVSPGLSSARSGVAAAIVGDGVIFGGGLGAASTYAPNVDKYLFSTKSMAFPFSASLSTARSNAVGVTVGTSTLRALFAGGETATSPVITGSSRSDVVASTGSVLSGDMTYARDYAQASPLPNGAALVTGGYLTFDTGTSTISYPLKEEIFHALSNGTACSGDFDCDSAHCVDGVCCDTTCTGQCQACNLSATKGTCTTVTSGNAISPRVSCDKYGTVCGSSCDGTFPDKCHYSTSATVCVGASCSSGSETLTTYCDGSGNCNTPSTSACTPYKCGATSCLTTCTSIADCATGYKCDASNHCVSTGGAGATCSTTAECNTGLTCVDGVCCTSSSCPSGEKCNIAPAAGTCKIPYGSACSAGTAAQCATGLCVDGVCCDTACSGECEACDAPIAGTCSPVVGPPHGSRTACGGTGVCQAQCNGSDRLACGAYPGSGTTCSAASCSGGAAVPSSTCNGLGGCTPVSSTPCTPYVCGATACKTSCATTTDCGSGYFCSGTTCVSTGAAGTTCTLDSQCSSGHCVDGVCCTVASCTAPATCAAKGDGTCSKPLKTSCASSSECGSGFCVDGVCCDKACNGQCEACDVSGSEGSCTAVAGPVHGSRTACGGTGACAAQCDGSTRTKCGAFPGTSTACAPASCSGSTYTATSYCDGFGSCPAGSTSSCGGFLCGGTTCKTTCTSTTTDCATGYACKSGTCQTTGDLGTTCTDDTQCTSGHCVDGGGATRVCCETATCPTGSVCADTSAGGSAGKCVKTSGATCASSAECISGFCVDGLCCESICSGQCEACNVKGAEGKCSPVTGPAHSPRTACSDGGGDVCKALSCDGTKDRTKCVAYLNGPDKACGAAVCKDGQATEAPHCDGSGACTPGKTSACAPFVCDATGCKTKCAKSADCVAGYGCDTSSGACTPTQATCSDDRSASVPSDKTQPPKPCLTYLCDPSTGNCFPSCTTADQCAAGNVCVDGVCSAAPTNSADSGSSGGCAIEEAPGGASGSSAVAVLLVGALAIIGRIGRIRRRRGDAIRRG